MSRSSWTAAPRSLYTPPATDPRYLSSDECHTIFQRIIALSVGGGDTFVTIEGNWRGNLRWALNRVTTAGDTIDHTVTITRVIRGAYGESSTNKLDDEGLTFALRTAERRVQLDKERPDTSPPPPQRTYLQPHLFDARTIALTAADRSAAGQRLVAPAMAANMLSAGYVEVGARTRGVFNTAGLAAYAVATAAQYSVTVRSPQDTGSGWAGVDANDWSKIDTAAISQRALRKCIDSANPKAIEPGRYTVILEPQAVHDFFFPAIQELDRSSAETLQTAYTQSPGLSKIGQRLLDPRITVSTDPMDPTCGYIPFDNNGEPYQATKWFTNGVLTNLAYDSNYALTELGQSAPRPNPYAYRMSGGTTSMEEMIASTMRGVLVTRFSDVMIIDGVSLLCDGLTRDGLWYVEHGAVKYPIKNFRFSESPLLAFNNVVALGVPQRVFARTPAVVPPAVVRDFHFTSLADVV
ncbi:MAG TPA: metallopeptidase TldD-related protein [Gemmatimonadaceae bacterium]|jgi:predicted Zn-dependent protease|nr:metallopeptidase TldD-related protein [Gemmatimonadaceae bacterium]